MQNNLAIEQERELYLMIIPGNPDSCCGVKGD